MPAPKPFRPELLSPAGNWDCAKAAVANGADAVYFGLDGAFNARARAAGFSADDLPEFLAFLHRAGTRGYVTLNTLAFSDELEPLEAIVRQIAEAGADGVHLGQTDMPIDEVRARYPGLGVIGLSTHNAAQALRAGRQAPAYIGVGPVHATPTKEIPDPVLGCAEAGRIIRSVSVPAVAIGGIDAATLPAVLDAGAVNFAVVRAVCDDPHPLDAIRRLQDIWAARRR